MKLLLRLAVAGGLLALVLRRVDLQRFAAELAGASWGWAVPMWCVMLAAFWLQVWVFSWIVRRHGTPLRTRTAFATSAISGLYALVLPGLVSSGVKWYMLRRTTGKGERLLSAMMYNQLTQIAVRILVAMAALAALLAADRPAMAGACVGGALVIVTLMALVLNRRTGPPVLRLLLRATAPLRGATGRKLRVFIGELGTIQSAGARFHLLIVALNLLAAALSVTVTVLAAQAARIDVPVSELALQSVVVYLLGRLPISVASLGVREYSLVQLLHRYGVPASAALTMSMFLFTGPLLRGLLGAAYALFWKPTPPEAVSEDRLAKTPPDPGPADGR